MGQYYQKPSGAFELIRLVCTLATMAVLAVTYWFLWRWLVPMLPIGDYDVIAFFILLPVSIVGTYNLFSMTIPGQKYLWDIRRRVHW